MYSAKKLFQFATHERVLLRWRCAVLYYRGSGAFRVDVRQPQLVQQLDKLSVFVQAVFGALSL